MYMGIILYFTIRLTPWGAVLIESGNNFPASKCNRNLEIYRLYPISSRLS